MRKTDPARRRFLVAAATAVATPLLPLPLHRLLAQQLPPGLTEYMGRPIAQTMTYHGAPWLTREERDAEENTTLLLQELRLQPGQTVCDLGCGNGYYTLLMAERVGPAGWVYASDIQPEMLLLLSDRADAAGATNVSPVLGTLIDPRVPAGTCDLVLLVDVYHEFSHPVQMLAKIHRALKPTGRVVFAEYREEDPLVPIKPLHKMSKGQLVRELRANGFKLVRDFDGLPWQHLMFFERNDGPSEAIDPKPWQPPPRPVPNIPHAND